MLQTNIQNPPENSHFLNFNRTQLREILSGKSKTGLGSLEDALNLFDEMTQKMRPPPSVMSFCQLLGGILNMKQYSHAVSLYRKCVFWVCPLMLIPCQ